MSKYIDADALIERINKKYVGNPAQVSVDFTAKRIINSINKMPAADVEPVRHGKWIKTDADFHDMPMEEFKCSMCGNLAHNLMDTTIPLPEFCDECGAKMDGGNEE